MPAIFCVIPAYNEAENIDKVIEDLIGRGYAIVVVNDGSRDNTSEIAKRDNVIVLDHLINRGQGAALETGNEYALIHNADIIVHFDADGQFNPAEINDVIGPILDNKADIVFGSRFMGKSSAMPFVKREIILPIARVVNYLFFGFILTDPQCGFRAMSRSAAQLIKIEQDGMAHCSEIMAKAFAHKLRIKEVPVTVIYNEYGQKLSGGLKIVKDILIKKIIS